MRGMISKMTDDIVTCITCGNSGPSSDVKTWHPFRHHLKTENDEDVPNVFKKPGPSSSGHNGAEASVSVVQSSMPFDPVLRQALIAKGILTPSDLREAEEAISAITGMMTQGVRHVPGTAGQ